MNLLMYESEVCLFDVCLFAGVFVCWGICLFVCFEEIRTCLYFGKAFSKQQVKRMEIFINRFICVFMC